MRPALRALRALLATEVFGLALRIDPVEVYRMARRLVEVVEEGAEAWR